MKSYTALKPCSFGSTEYAIGAAIPAEVVDATRAPALMKYGYIREADEPMQPAEVTPEAIDTPSDPMQPADDDKKNKQGKRGK